MNDPEFFVLWETVQTFRRCGNVPDTIFVLDHLSGFGPHRPAPGPCATLLERLHQIGWSWLGNHWVNDHWGLPIHLIDAPVQLLATRLQQAWTLHVGSTMTDRSTFAGLHEAHRDFTMQDQRNWSDEQSAIMRTAMNGTFFTRDKQIHSGKVDSKQCPWCAHQDSLFHRYWECEHFEDLRAAVPPDHRDQLLAMPECTHLHGWFTFTDLDRQLEEEWTALPDTRGHFESVQHLHGDLHFFVDGGCLNATLPGLRVGTWAIAAADLDQDTFCPLAQGFVPGRVQTAMRAELTAAGEAILCGLAANRRFSIWTDNQAVFRRLSKWLRDPGREFPTRSRNADLWNQLRRRTLVALEADLLVVVCKVRSHQDPALYSDVVEQRAFRGNNFVDQMTHDVLQSMPPRLWQTLTAKRLELQQRTALRKSLHALIYQIGARAIASRGSWSDPAPASEQTDPVNRALLDAQSSVEPLPTTLDGLTLPSNVAQHGDQLLNWLLKLQEGPVRSNKWISSYQLFAHFQAHSGDIGFHYDTKRRQYVAFSDYASGNYSFVRGASWFSGMLKCLCKHMGVPYLVDYKAPAGTTLQGWHRCVLMRLSDDVISHIDRLFSNEGVRHVKKIQTAFASVDGFWPKA
eukprot:Skav202416  [mRNA]  locus=scaffold1370:238535:240418:- [translate_table: standard]